MILPFITQIGIVGIADRGIPNRERIVLRPMEPTNLMQYVLVLGLRAEDGMIRPLVDHVLWLPDMVVEPPSWMVVYTAPGQLGWSSDPATGHKVLSAYWGKAQTVLKDQRITAALFSLSGIQIAPADFVPRSTLAPPQE